MKYDLFLSYAGRDREHVERLVKKLESVYGSRVFWDGASSPTRPFTGQIPEALLASQAVVFLVSDAWSGDPTGCGGYRLPSEAEWEWAARGGGRGEPYVGTSDAKEVCRFDNAADEMAREKEVAWDTFACDDGFAETAPVGRFRANRFLLYDMGGNVREWCWEQYSAYWYEGVVEPTPALQGVFRVLRGGSWLARPRDARLAYRDMFLQSVSYVDIGFRVARYLPSAALPSCPLPTVTPGADAALGGSMVSSWLCRIRTEAADVRS